MKPQQLTEWARELERNRDLAGVCKAFCKPPPWVIELGSDGYLRFRRLNEEFT